MREGPHARLPDGAGGAERSRDGNGLVARSGLSRWELAVAAALCVLHTAGIIYGLWRGGLLILLAWFGVVMLAGIGISVFIRLNRATTP